MGIKGILAQINQKPSQLNEDISIKDLQDIVSSIIKESNKQRKKNDKVAKENIKHLQKRAKELNKEIPIQLLVLLSPNINPKGIISSSTYFKYKEWLDD